jgi:regulatory protein
VATEDLRARLAAQIAGVQAAPSRPAGSDPDAQPLPEGGQAALSFLIRSATQRPITVAEAADKLRQRDIPDPVAAAVIDRAVAGRLLDDEAFARAWVEDRGLKRGYGRQRLQRELRRRKVPADLIETALAILDDHDEIGQATQLARTRAQRMPADLDPAKVAGRLVGFLVRRGYSSHVAHDVARKVTATDRTWD